MRDLLIVVLVFGSVPLILVRPQVGIIMWFWLSLMNPHRLAWGYAQELRVALVVGLATLVAWICSRESKVPPNSPIIYVMAAFTFWLSLAALFAIHPETSIPKWEEIVKILLMTFVTTCIVRSRDRINQVIWVIVVSIGAYGIKGGLFTIATAGHYRVWGPEDTFIGDNNALALALIMVVPLMHYLRTQTASYWLRLCLMIGMGLLLLSILASYSRGALIGLGMSLAFFLLKARTRFFTIFAIVAVLFGALSVAPPEWYGRMHTIGSFEDDESVQGRFDAWLFSYRLALDHPFVGGGQLIGLDEDIFMQYVPNAQKARAAHSIYFEVLGETGFVGLAIFIALLITSYLTARNIIGMTRYRPDLAWAKELASMIQVSIVGYATAGASLSLGFFDLYYVLVAMLAVTQLVVRRELKNAPLKGSLELNSPTPPSAGFGYPLNQPYGTR